MFGLKAPSLTRAYIFLVAVLFVLVIIANTVFCILLNAPTVKNVSFIGTSVEIVKYPLTTTMEPNFVACILFVAT